MNYYDAQPTGLKATGVVAGFIPPIVAGWLTGSWIVAIVTYFGGAVIGIIGTSVVANICRARHTSATGETDVEGVARCMILPFLFFPPLAGAAVGWYLVRHGLPW